MVDAVFVMLLLAVSGWTIDSWNDTRVPYTGLIVTSFWLLALMFSASAPLLAYALHRRKAKPERIMVTLWLPALILVTLMVAGLIVTPP